MGVKIERKKRQRRDILSNKKKGEGENLEKKHGNCLK